MCSTAVFLFFGLLTPGVLCQFNTPLPVDLTATVDEDVTLTWDIMHFSHILNIQWSVVLDSNTSTSLDILVWFSSGTNIVQNEYNVKYAADGSITLTSVALNNTGVYKILVTYKTTTPGDATAEDTVKVTVQGQPTTTTVTITTTTMQSSTTTTPTTTTAETTTTPTEAITTTTLSKTAQTTDSTTDPTKSYSTTARSSNESTVIIVVASSIGGVVLVGLVVFLVGLFLYRARRHGHGKHKHNHKRNTRRQQSGGLYIYSGPTNGQNMEMQPSTASYTETRHGYPPSIKDYLDRRLVVTNQKQPTQRHEGSQMRNIGNVKSRYSVYPGNLVHSGNSQNFSPNHYPRYKERQRPATTGNIHPGHVNHAHPSGYTLYHPQDYSDNRNMY